MCIVITQNLKPTKTSLVCVDLLDNTKLIVYHNESIGEGNQCMIIPFPLNPKDVNKASLVNVSQMMDNNFIKLVRSKFPVAYSRGKGTRGTLHNKSMKTDSLDVHICGGWKASMALNYDDLSRLDFKALDVNENFQSIIDDVKIRFENGYGFVIATPHKNENGQFGGCFAWTMPSMSYAQSKIGVLSSGPPEPIDAYFPTTHERSQLPFLTRYNVDCYYIGHKIDRTLEKQVRWEKSLVPEKSIYDYVTAYYNVDCSEIISLLKTCKTCKDEMLNVKPDLNFGVSIKMKCDLWTNDNIVY